MAAKKKKKKINNNTRLIVIFIVGLAVLFVGVFFATFFVIKALQNNNSNIEETTTAVTTTLPAETTQNVVVQTTETTDAETTTIKETTAETTTKKEPEWTGGTLIDYPADDASWKMICVNRYRYVGASVESSIKLSKVAGSSERMDSRAAAAYDDMYEAAKADGYRLTPCSGYRSYSTQKRLYNEFVNDYISAGKTEAEAHDLASKRRNPPGSSEHNLGICMDIICAASSANFQNTSEYEWLCENAHKYGFILRYPEDKVSVTGVKFEPWHWRYVGVENAQAIKDSGLCLEEYLGIA